MGPTPAVALWQHGGRNRAPTPFLANSEWLMAGILPTSFPSFLAAWLVAGACAAAEPALKVPFDGPETRWQAIDNQAARLLAHQCVPDGVRNSGGAERLVIAAPAGQSVWFACPTGRMPLIDEFRVRLWVKASRPAVQLAARVVLPRSRDPKTGANVTAIVRGPLTQQVGRWQQLELAGVPKLLANQVRVLRAAPAAAIDPREAYVDAIMLAVPGEPQGCEVLTDELEVDGVLVAEAKGAPAGNTANQNEPSAAATQINALPAAAARSPSTSSGWRQELGAPDDKAVARATQRVRLQGTSLLVDGKPFATRAIEWNGEPLAFLAERGFNAVELRQPPTPEQLADAERLDLWFICPPPPDAPAPSSAPHDWERVLVWRLEDGEAHDDAAHFRNWAELVRGRDDLPRRPVLIAPQNDWTALSYCADLLLARHPLDATLPPTQYGEWLTTCGRLARPSTAIWTSIATQFGETVRAQAAALSRKSLPSLSVDDDHLETAVRVAYTRGCRGFVFRSNSPLNESDPATRRRAALVEFMNRHLQLVGPWLAGGAVTGEIDAADAPVKAVILSVDRTRLIVPMSREPGAGSREQGESPTETPRSPLPALRHGEPSARSFVVAGIPDSNQVFLLTPASMRPLAAKRVSGGTRLALEAADDGLVVISQDPQIIVSLRQRIARDAPGTLRLERELARLQAAAISETSRSLAKLRYNCQVADEFAAAAEAKLQQADSLLAAGRGEQAHVAISAARRQLRQAVDQQRRIVGQAAGVGSYPLAVSYDTLVEHAGLLRSVDSLHSGDNLLYGGDFESLDQLTQFGWQHIAAEASGLTPHAELSSREPYHGRYCLRLNVAAAQQDHPPVATDRVGIRIISPAIPVEPGQLIEITGWARIPEPTPGQTADLEIVDSLGGPELSLPLAATHGWQPFQVVRAATANELHISFGLSRQGTAELDAVMVRPLRQPVARRLPPPDSPTGAPPVQR